MATSTYSYQLFEAGQLNPFVVGSVQHAALSAGHNGEFGLTYDVAGQNYSFFDYVTSSHSVLFHDDHTGEVVMEENGSGGFILAERGTFNGMQINAGGTTATSFQFNQVGRFPNYGIQDLALTPDGLFFAAIRAGTNVPSTGTRATVAIYDSSGHSYSSGLVYHESYYFQTQEGMNLQAESLSDGRYVFAFYDGAEFGGTAGMVFTIQGGPTVLFQAGPSVPYELLSLHDGGFAISLGSQVRLFNSSGVERTTVTFDAVLTNISTLDNGFLLLTGSNFAHSEIYGEVVDPSSGAVVVPQFLLRAGATNTVSDGAIQGLDGGRFVAAWTEAGQSVLTPAGTYIAGREGQIIHTTNGDGTSETLLGDALRDVMYGNGGDDNFYGFGGDDVLSGSSGNDNFFGGLGADQMYGGDGFDYARYDDAAYDGLVADMIGISGNTGAAAGDTYRDIEGLILTGNDDVGLGREVADYLYGLGGNDTLYGRGGDDFLDGGSGDDTIYGGAGFDTVVHGAGSGADRIMDFEGGTGLNDRIDVRGLFSNFAEVLAASHWTPPNGSGSGVVTIIAAGTALTLENFYLGNLAADDFIFAT